VRMPRLVVMLVLCGAFSAANAAIIVPEAASPDNVARYGTASAYEGVLATPASAAINLLAGLPDTNCAMTITGLWLGLQVALASPADLVKLSALVDPPGSGNDPYKNTDSVEFLISTNGGLSFLSLGTVTSGTDYDVEGHRNWLMSIEGSYADVTHVRYRFHQADDGYEGQRIWEVMAITATTTLIPEPGSAALLILGSLVAGRCRIASRRRKAGAGG